MLASKKNLLWIIYSVLMIYMCFIGILKAPYIIYIFSLGMIAFIAMYIKSKKVEESILNAIGELSRNSYVIKIEEIINFVKLKHSKYALSDTQVSNTVNYYKSKGIIPYDIIVK